MGGIKVPDREARDQTDLSSFNTVLMLSQLLWAGHVARMPDHRLPKTLFYGGLQQGQRSHGGQEKRFKDTLNTSLNAFSIIPDTWDQTRMDRPRWRYSTYRGANFYVQKGQLQHNKRGGQGKPAPVSKSRSPTFLVQVVTAHSVHGIGLISHLRIHESSPNPKMTEVVLVEWKDEQQHNNSRVALRSVRSKDVPMHLVQDVNLCGLEHAGLAL